VQRCATLNIKTNRTSDTLQSYNNGKTVIHVTDKEDYFKDITF